MNTINALQIPFEVTDWNQVETTLHPGETGHATWKRLQYQHLRIRVVEYSANYKADHWCDKGHLLFCLEGAMTTELSDGRKFTLTAGMSYQVSDQMSLHMSTTEKGVKLLIVDGGFLQRKKGVWF
jgi:quercetin dioxygenase-like cupin family protein